MARNANPELVDIYRTGDNFTYLTTAITWAYAALPDDEKSWPGVYESRVDCWSLIRFNDRKILNWCPSLRTLYPIITYGMIIFSSLLVIITFRYIVLRMY
jgi:hypothetical protein